VNCLDEWKSGEQITVAFTGDQYEHVYTDILSLSKDVLNDPYHGDKLHRLLSKIATDGL
jgi:Domain of unknown function (DUF6532)